MSSSECNQCRDDPEILSLLGFDPYFIIGDDLLEKLFPLNSEEAERIISDSDVELFAAAFKNHSSALASILDYSLQTEKIDPQERMRVTRTIITEWMEKGRGLYVDLRKELDKFSIFAGRNPVVRTATPASVLYWSQSFFYTGINNEDKLTDCVQSGTLVNILYHPIINQSLIRSVIRKSVENSVSFVVMKRLKMCILHDVVCVREQ